MKSIQFLSSSQTFKMFSLKARNIFDTFEPLQKVSQPFGLTSFSIKINKGTYKTFNSIGNVFFITVFSVWSLYCAFCYAMFLKDSPSEKKPFMSEIFQKTISAVMLTFLTLSTFLNWWIFSSQRVVCRALNLIQLVDEDFSKNGLSTNFGKQKTVLIIGISASFVVTTFGVMLANSDRNVFDIYDNWALVMFSFACCVEHWYLITLHFTFFMWIVMLRFETLNLYLNGILNETEIKAEDNLKIRKASEIFEMLVEVCECFNQSYGIPV